MSHLGLTLAPATLVTDGHSTSTVTVTATDATGHPVAGETITISSSDPGQKISAVTDNGDGTYSAVITASKKSGSALITATDAVGGISVTATASLASTSTALAFTGADDSWMLPTGAGALLAVGLLLFFVRRRSLHRA